MKLPRIFANALTRQRWTDRPYTSVLGWLNWYPLKHLYFCISYRKDLDTGEITGFRVSSRRGFFPWEYEC